jgi:hypothetical protein
MRADVDRWRGDADIVFIALRLKATVGRRIVEWPNVDRFVLRDRKAIERADCRPIPGCLPTSSGQTIGERWLRGSCLLPGCQVAAGGS